LFLIRNVLTYADHRYISVSVSIGGCVCTIRTNAEALAVVGRGNILGVHADKTTHILMSLDRNIGESRHLHFYNR